jgi:hypothetical protein
MIIIKHNTNKPEDYKMKTNRNFFSQISKASMIIALAFASLFTVSCQNAARQSFHYRADFIKQMIYQISNEFFSKDGEASCSTKSNSKEAATVLVNYTVSVKNLKASSNNNELADFLTRAAQLNAPVAEVENDNTIDFLTQAAQLNAPVAEMEADQEHTIDFLTTAAQLNAPVAQENSSNDDTLDFLCNAAQLNMPVAAEETSQDNNLIDFLTEAAHLNENVAE